MPDIVAKLQQGNYTAQDVDEAVAEILRLRRFLEVAESSLDDAEDEQKELCD